MQDFPVNFQDKVTMGGGAGGTGYPYQISASDLMANFEYAALDADDSWIESTGTSTGQGRKLKLPALPGGGSNVLSSEGGDPQWIDKDDFLKDLQYKIDLLVDRLDILDGYLEGMQEEIDGLTYRLDSANITAQCDNGSVDVTLNI